MMSIHDQLSQAQANLVKLQQDAREAQLKAIRGAVRNGAGNYSPNLSTILADAAAPYMDEIQQAQATVSRLSWECQDEINQLTGALPD